MRKTSGSSLIACIIASRTASRYVTSLGIDILQRRPGFGIGLPLGLLEGFFDPLPGLLLQLPPLVLFEQTLLFQLYGEPLYGVLLTPHGDLLPAPVEVRVALGVPQVAVGDGFQQAGPLAAAGTLGGLGGRLMHLVELHA